MRIVMDADDSIKAGCNSKVIGMEKKASVISRLNPITPVVSPEASMGGLSAH